MSIFDESLREISKMCKKYKYLRRRKCLRRDTYWNIGVRVEEGKRGHLAPKMNITFYITNYRLNTFLFNNFFEKSSIFRGNHGKPFLGTFDQFLGKGGVLPQKVI